MPRRKKTFSRSPSKTVNQRSRRRNLQAQQRHLIFFNNRNIHLDDNTTDDDSDDDITPQQIYFIQPQPNLQPRVVLHNVLHLDGAPPHIINNVPVAAAGGHGGDDDDGDDDDDDDDANHNDNNLPRVRNLPQQNNNNAAVPPANHNNNPELAVLNNNNDVRNRQFTLLNHARQPLHGNIPPHHTLGDFNHVCQFCGAFKFLQENFKCCMNGKVDLPILRDYPPRLLDLFQHNDAQLSQL